MLRMFVGKMRKFFLLLLIFLPFISLAETRFVSIKECIDIGIQNSPDVAIEFENQKIAEAGQRKVESLKKPSVSFDARTITDKIDTDSEEKERSKSLQFYKLEDYKIGLFSGVSARYKLLHPDYSSKLDLSKKSVELARLSEYIKKSEIILSIKKAYYNYLLSKHISALKAKIEENYKKRLNVVSVLVKNGERPILDLSTAEVNYARASLDYRKAKNDQDYRKKDLLASMGIFEVVEGDYDFLDIDEVTEFTLSLDSILELADNNSPLLMVAKYKKEMSRLEIAISKAGDNLSVDVVGSLGYQNETLYKRKYMKENTDKKNWNLIYLLNIVASMPLYTGGAYSASVDESIAKYNKESYNELSVSNDIKKKISATYSLMVVMMDQMKISKLNVENARTNLRLAQLSYDSGTGSQLTLQTAEYSLFQSEMEILSSKYEYLQNRAVLANMIGVDEELLCKK